MVRQALHPLCRSCREVMGSDGGITSAAHRSPRFRCLKLHTAWSPVAAGVVCGAEIDHRAEPHNTVFPFTILGNNILWLYSATGRTTQNYIADALRFFLLVAGNMSSKNARRSS